jgi:alkylated DNA repair dioxygenase AlkB
MSFYNSPTKRLIQLTNSSSIITDELPTYLQISKEEFEYLWSLRPQEEQYIKMLGKKIAIPRRNKAYGKSYSFAGITEEKAQETPDIIQRYIDYTGGNGALVNWYDTGLEYIGPHSDNEKQLVKDSDIFTISFGENRTFRVRPTKVAQHKYDKELKKDFNTQDNEIIVMSGKFQEEFKHSIPLTKKIKNVGKWKGKRISITIRTFQ